jgi:predicted transcriptional regulator
MKTAISIPDEVFTAADRLAGRLGVSRSHLYATAVAEYVARHRASRVTERLDAVYRAEPSGVEGEVRRAQRRAVRRAPW